MLIILRNFYLSKKKGLFLSLEYLYHFDYIKGMLQDIVKESIHHMHTDVKIIRLTFLTSFFHSLIVILLIILNLNSYLAKNYENGLYIGKVAEYLVQEINKNNFVTIVIAITIFLFVAYSIIYPVGQSAIIHYLKDKKNIRSALKKWLKDFFPMFEYGIISVITSPTVFFITFFRVFILWTTHSTIIIILFILWFVVINIINILKSYTRYCITLEWLPLYEALKRSFLLSSHHFKNSMKFVRIQTILLITFSLNLLMVAGLPFLLIYLSIAFGIIEIVAVKILIYSIFVFMILLSSYMSSFIRAFFAYYWLRLYENVKK